MTVQNSRVLRVTLSTIFALLVAASSGLGQALAAASPWVAGQEAKARLLAGIPQSGSGPLAFIEIALTPGWKTYWRTPGDAGGLPPAFDWSKSTNLAAAKVAFPAPQRFTDKSGNAHSHSWDFGEGSTSKEANPTHTFPDTGSYRVCLTVSGSFTCSDNICETVKIIPVPVIYAPSAFSPNGDGTNDVFRIVTAYAEEFSLQIFDRWGELIFSTTEPGDGWDGTYQGRKVQSDMYLWRLKLRDSLKKTHLEDGRVTLLE